MLTACGIETAGALAVNVVGGLFAVATVLTACGIETRHCNNKVNTN